MVSSNGARSRSIQYHPATAIAAMTTSPESRESRARVRLELILAVRAAAARLLPFASTTLFGQPLRSRAASVRRRSAFSRMKPFASVWS